jgi:predicted transcriptional regulator
MQVKDCVLIEAFKCNENENVVEVAKKLSEVTLRHIFVADDNEYPVGIISVLDINNRVVAENKNLAETTAKDVMSAPIRVAKMEEDAKTLADEMIKNSWVMTPVVNEENKMVGIVTLNQLMQNE